jgi:DNA-binding winged helix-turn-helix (wHTH) protein
MTDNRQARGYRFGVFELDAATGELRHRGLRVKLHTQPFQVLSLLLERPGEMLTREEICRELWPEGTFVDYEHGLNSAINRLREALGDKASNPRFIETLARRGYRFIAPVERINPAEDSPEEVAPAALPAELWPPPEVRPGYLDHLLATPEDLPQTSSVVVQTLFLLLQVMYLGFYVGALANLTEIEDLFAPLSVSGELFATLIVTAAILIPVRIFLLCGVLFRAPGMREKFRKIWWLLLPLDALWSAAPFLLLHHIPYGLALACMAPLVYSPFAQRSLILMGAGEGREKKNDRVERP